MENENIIVAQASELEKAQFYKKTYSHVAVAILAFIVVETLLLNILPIEWIIGMVAHKFMWLFIIGLMWLGSSLSERMTFHPSRQQQYLGLGAYVILEAIIFLPLITIAMATAGTEILSQAALITLFMFSGLTAVVFLTKADFSFLRTAITVGGFIALGLIVCGAIFGFNLGLWFSVGMVVLASASILYETSKLKDQYNTEQYVGAALRLFASVMLLFWYILRILMSRKN
ncbi:MULTISPECIES: Bax inhibitor-1/YccA family protein [Flavobacterium]|uniref:Bax inhibitor-1 family protein n=1 Tax=Flavobacterium hankyongi TaxID=1176532 RepID=A0ABP8ZJB9_9FLAO|nr:Bax inhibitor-1 family protein [Flavobacterium sp. N1846]